MQATQKPWRTCTECGRLVQDYEFLESWDNPNAYVPVCKTCAKGSTRKRL